MNVLNWLISSCVQLDETDQSQDDFLKLDATAEVDEFSRFLNEFENELETDDVKSTKAATDDAKPAKTAKKARIETERKTVDGKKMRKKIKAKRAQTPSLSPEGGSGRWRRGRRESPLSRRSPGNTNRDRPNIRQSPNRDRTNRQSPFGQKKGERTSRPPMEEKREEEEKARREMEEQEKKEYEERLAKLPSPERKRLEARRKKFDSKVSFQSILHFSWGKRKLGNLCRVLCILLSWNCVRYFQFDLQIRSWPGILPGFGSS